MKVLVIFGSQSDANIYESLKARLLAEQIEIEFKMLSVHRSPELLDKELAGSKVDAVVAGAGLAAHLPGILASKLLLPVVGVPCGAALGGLDATYSVMQMPFGIPVLTTAPDQYGDAVMFLKRWSSTERSVENEGIHVVLDRAKRSLAYIPELLDRAAKIAEKTHLDLQLKDRPGEYSANVCLVDIDPKDPEAPLPYPPVSMGSQELRIYVPILSPQAYRDPASALLVLRRMNSLRDGLWVGLNNVGNGVLAALQLYNRNGQFNAFLTHAKKGYIHR